jgi:hypothetical protein
LGRLDPAYPDAPSTLSFLRDLVRRIRADRAPGASTATLYVEAKHRRRAGAHP